MAPSHCSCLDLFGMCQPISLLDCKHDRSMFMSPLPRVGTQLLSIGAVAFSIIGLQLLPVLLAIGSLPLQPAGFPLRFGLAKVGPFPPTHGAIPDTAVFLQSGVVPGAVTTRKDGLVTPLHRADSCHGLSPSVIVDRAQPTSDSQTVAIRLVADNGLVHGKVRGAMLAPAGIVGATVTARPLRLRAIGDRAKAGCGRIATHRKLIPFGVMPPGVPASRGPYFACIIPYHCHLAFHPLALAARNNALCPNPCRYSPTASPSS